MRQLLNGRLGGRASILAAAMIWGVSFVVLKNTLDSVEPLWSMGIRFVGAAIILGLVSIRQLKKINRRYLAVGTALGVTMFLAYIFQTYGLKYTTPGKNAFLTSAYCVMVPFMGWFIYKIKIDRWNILAAVICVIGIGLVSLEGDISSINLGDVLTLICSIFFTAQIIILDRYLGDMSLPLVAGIQFAVVGVLSFIIAPIFEPVPIITLSMLPELLYLCVMCSVAAFLFQCYGQKRTPAAESALLFTLEAVFGVIVSVIFYHERLSLQLFCGFLLIFCAVVISETKLSFLKRPEKLSRVIIKAPQSAGAESKVNN